MDKSGIDGSGRSIDVFGPDGCAYVIRSRRRGELLRDWHGVDTAFGPLDFIIFFTSLFGRIFTLLRVRASHGWSIGVLREGALRAKVVHKEHVEHEDLVVHRVRELARQVELGSFDRG